MKSNSVILSDYSYIIRKSMKKREQSTYEYFLFAGRLFSLFFHFIKHRFCQNSITPGRVTDEDMGDGAYESSVLNDGRSRHALDDAIG